MGGGKLSHRARSIALAVGVSAGIAITLAVALIGGSSDPDPGRKTDAAAAKVVQGGAPGQPSRTLSDEELEAIRPPKYVAADVDFAQGMIHHHAQALEMAGFVPERAVGKDIPLLAERIEISQTAEIELLENWLKARDEEVPGNRDHADAHGGMLMPGMLTEAQMARLEAADGSGFNRRFLASMIRHHRGAITMVRELRDANGGMEPEIDKMAREIESDQAIEIQRMQALLAAR